MGARVRCAATTFRGGPRSEFPSRSREPKKLTAPQGFVELGSQRGAQEWKLTRLCFALTTENGNPRMDDHPRNNNQQEGSSNSALHNLMVATQNGAVQVRLPSSSGASPRRRDVSVSDSGTSPALALAQERGAERNVLRAEVEGERRRSEAEVTKLLLEAGTQRGTPNRQGARPLDLPQNHDNSTQWMLGARTYAQLPNTLSTPPDESIPNATGGELADRPSPPPPSCLTRAAGAHVPGGGCGGHRRMVDARAAAPFQRLGQPRRQSAGGENVSERYGPLPDVRVQGEALPQAARARLDGLPVRAPRREGAPARPAALLLLGCASFVPPLGVPPEWTGVLELGVPANKHMSATNPPVLTGAMHCTTSSIPWERRQRQLS